MKDNIDRASVEDSQVRDVTTANQIFSHIITDMMLLKAAKYSDRLGNWHKEHVSVLK